MTERSSHRRGFLGSRYYNRVRPIGVTIPVLIACFVTALLAAGTHAQAPKTAKAAPTPPPALEILWKSPLPSVSAPAVATNGALVLLTDPRAGLFAYRGEDGSLAWSTPDLTSTMAAGASAAHVAVVSNGALHILAADTGARVGRVALDAVPQQLMVTPARALVVFEHEVRAFRPDGTLEWRTAVTSAIVTSTAVSGALLFAGVRPAGIVAIDLATGRQTLTMPTAAEPKSLAVQDGRAFFGGSDRALFGYEAVRPGAGHWRFALPESVGKPDADTRRVYFAMLDHSARALDARHGNIQWRRELPSRPAIGPVLFEDSLAVVLTTGEVLELAASDGKVRDPQSGTRLPTLSVKGVAVSKSPPRVATLVKGNDDVFVLYVWGRPKPKG